MVSGGKKRPKTPTKLQGQVRRRRKKNPKRFNIKELDEGTNPHNL